jgi:hypothetical protein
VPEIGRVVATTPRDVADSTAISIVPVTEVPTWSMTSRIAVVEVVAE